MYVYAGVVLVALYVIPVCLPGTRVQVHVYVHMAYLEYYESSFYEVQYDYSVL